jgi:hypothetical protein
MQPFTSLLSFLAARSALDSTSLTNISSTSAFNLTAISASNGQSILECWQLSAQTVQAGTAGIDGASIQPLGSVANATLTFLPANFDGGVHNAPVNQ